jgi:hypothetical protein
MPSIPLLMYLRPDDISPGIFQRQENAANCRDGWITQPGHWPLEIHNARVFPLFAEAG